MDETASSATYFAAAQQPNTSFTMANTAFASTHNGGGAVITATTAGGSDGAKNCNFNRYRFKWYCSN